MVYIWLNLQHDAVMQFK